MTLARRRLLAAGVASLATVANARKPRAEDPIGQLQLRDPPAAAPDLRWTDAAGAPHRPADYLGQGLVLNFWATWCAPCVAEMPSLAALATLLRPDRIAVVPVSSDAGGAAAVQRFYADHRIGGLAVWLDPRGAALQPAGVIGLPTTLVLDRRGREVARVTGAADWSGAGTAATIRALCDM